MANHEYKILSEDSIKYLCSLIRDVSALPSSLIDDINVQTVTSYSSFKLEQLLTTLKQENEEYADALVAGLNKLTKEIITDQSQITNENVLYLLLIDSTNSIYQQWLLINGTPTMIGTTEMSLDSVYSKDEADSKFATKQSVTDINTVIGTETLSTTSTTLKGAINEVYDKSSEGTMLSVTKEQYDNLVAGQTVTIDGKDYTYDSNTYYVITDDTENVSVVTSISSSSTDSEVPTAKAVNVECKHGRIITNDVIATYGTEISKYPTGKWVIYRNDLAVQFTDLPSKAACRINIYGLLDNNFTPFNTSWQYRMITVTDINGKLYTREFNSGNTAGVFEQDTGWQRVITTKVADVPWTTITPTSVLTRGIIRYRVKNGICYVKMDDIISTTMSTNNQILVTGLPKPEPDIDDMWYPLASNLNSTSAPIQNLLVRLTNDGNIINYNGTNDTSYYGSFSYPVKEL